jgi:hypothetical protein
MDKSKTPPSHLGSCRDLTFVPRSFGFVHHSIAILYHEVPNPNMTIRDFLIAVPRADQTDSSHRPEPQTKRGGASMGVV